MNPTEYFIARLMELLEKHQAKTGTYIERININRVNTETVAEVRHSYI